MQKSNYEYIVESLFITEIYIATPQCYCSQARRLDHGWPEPERIGGLDFVEVSIDFGPILCILRLL